MYIFISWSKKISMEYALELQKLLEKLEINVFISQKDIIAGDDVQEEILKNIVKCDKIILCFTKENKKSPWLLYEAGYAKGLNKTVIPLLFDNDLNWHSWIDNPMNVAKEIEINSPNFVQDFINGLGLDSIHKKQVSLFYNKIIKLKETNRLVDGECEDVVDKMLTSDAFMLPNPTFRNRTAYFSTGFESYDLYKIITESFMYTGKTLWIYGRKNMKLFGGNFKDFFKYLDEKSYTHESMAGIDFRCLFLNPNSKEIETAHPQQEIFKFELISTLYRAKDVLGGNIRLQKCFRLYDDKRESVIIRLDNCIIYSRPTLNANGIPQLLTDTQFEVFSSESERGMQCVKQFECIWEKSTEISSLEFF